LPSLCPARFRLGRFRLHQTAQHHQHRPRLRRPQLSRLSLLSSPWQPSLDALLFWMNATKGVGAEMHLPLRLRLQLRRE
jgi:hypothetical protein